MGWIPLLAVTVIASALHVTQHRWRPWLHRLALRRQQHRWQEMARRSDNQPLGHHADCPCFHDPRFHMTEEQR